MSNVKIVTVATESKYYFPYLQETIKTNNNELIVLGLGEKWQGFSWRYELMLNYLKTLQSDDIVCFVDGYDVLCLRNLNELPNAFFKIKKETGCKIIVGFSNYENKVNKYINYFYFGECNKKSLNAGTYIGLAKDLLNVINKLYKIKDPKKDDQIMLNQYCIDNPTDIYIDDLSQIFLAISNPYKNINSKLLIKNKKVYFNNEQPFFIHAYGNTYMDNLLIKLGYKNVTVSKDIYNGFHEDLKTRAYSFFHNLLTSKIFLAMIIVLFIITIMYYFRNNRLMKKYNILKKLYKYNT
jgi:hypothetical protein